MKERIKKDLAYQLVVGTQTVVDTGTQLFVDGHMLVPCIQDYHTLVELNFVVHLGEILLHLNRKYENNLNPLCTDGVFFLV